MSTNTDARALLDVLDVLSNADGLANNLVANDARVGRLAPTRAERVDVTARMLLEGHVLVNRDYYLPQIPQWEI